MPIEVVRRYSRKDLLNNPLKLYIFGDNWVRQGWGGQAGETRGEPNAVGVRTKRAPTYEEPDFLTDATYVENIRAIFEDFQPILSALEKGRTVVWPADGIGTGIARLPELAPLTLHFIRTLIESLKKAYGTTETEA